MATDRRKGSMESSRSPRSSKHHHSRSRSRSRDRKRDKKHRLSRSRSKEARRKDLEDRPSKQQKSEEQREQTDRARERLSENGEERHRRKDGRAPRGRSHSRSRSRERHHRSRSRERKRSRSRSRDRRSRSRDRRRRGRSRSGSRPRHRSRSRSKSRERKKRSEKLRKRSRSRSRSASPPAFRGRNTAMDAQEALARRLERAKKIQEQKEKEMLAMQKQQELVPGCAAGPSVPSPLSCDAVAAATNSAVLNVAALLASGTQVTPQIAMAVQMAALQAKALAETGMAVPSYYNPSAVNAMKLAEQEKKRKMLWQGKKEGDKSQTAELWEKLSFGNKDQNTKFRKLMGIKDEEGSGPNLMDDESLRTLKQQEEVFRNLDAQYEMARSQTHTQRGMGLGFSSAFSSRGMDTL
ncbi:arginine/serine-rich coiled-coil protein 2-like [Megalops cyprinoides]|uniref:arginine/serine-rich coiled-coil protein 2-like n=1 Tax=Megalops cyprinoides TaxID=118141 RepID=UPI0018649EC8|nr:arginine/serine-rich coiled-coil protein 2-like [Megalops cyprinoides]